jgi:hypothetical protein
MVMPQRGHLRVTQSTCALSASVRSSRPTISAVVPPTPTSASSSTRQGSSLRAAATT